MIKWFATCNSLNSAWHLEGALDMLLIIVTCFPALWGDNTSTSLFVIQWVPSRRRDTKQASCCFLLVAAIHDAGLAREPCTCSVNKAHHSFLQRSSLCMPGARPGLVQTLPQLILITSLGGKECPYVVRMEVRLRDIRFTLLVPTAGKWQKQVRSRYVQIQHLRGKGEQVSEIAFLFLYWKCVYSLLL